MCGIFGTSRITPTTRAMFPFLAWAMESRGTDSWGASDGLECVRHLGPISASYELPDWRWAIIHTRMASVGAVNLTNCHPFEFPTPDGGRLIGIHNGGISNYAELNRKYERKFDCDSPHIYANLAAGLPLEDLRGTAALAWIATPHSGTPILNLARINSNNLEVCKLESGEVVFASELRPIVKAACFARAKIATTYKIKEDRHYYIELDALDHTPYEGDKMEFGRYQYSGTSHACGYTGGSSKGWVGEKNFSCVGCNTKYALALHESPRVVCIQCLTKIKDRFDRGEEPTLPVQYSGGGEDNNDYIN